MWNWQSQLLGGGSGAGARVARTHCGKMVWFGSIMAGSFGPGLGLSSTPKFLHCGGWGTGFLGNEAVNFKGGLTDRVGDRIVPVILGGNEGFSSAEIRGHRDDVAINSLWGREIVGTGDICAPGASRAVGGSTAQ